MRDPNRIPIVLEALRVAWERYPDLRLGQLLVNATPNGQGLFYIEDRVWLDRLRALVEEEGTVTPATPMSDTPDTQGKLDGKRIRLRDLDRGTRTTLELLVVVSVLTFIAIVLHTIIGHM